MSRPAPPLPHGVPNLNLGQARAPLFEVTLQVVTPMFGGGAAPGVVDPLHPVRGGSVRGHLRFWWRACNAHRWPTPQALFDDEAAIWGQTAASNRPGAPSAIDVEVEIDKTGEPQPKEQPHSKQWMDDEFGYPSYALFPFQRQNNPPRPPSKAQIGVAFTVRLSVAHRSPPLDHQQLEKAAEAALWAWITFGGVGARTRRGCGALWCTDSQFSPSSVETASEWLAERTERCVNAASAPDSLPLPLIRGSRVLLAADADTPVVAWSRSVAEMQAFRQGKGVGRRSGRDESRPRKLGQSYWPEADSIRDVARTYSRGHEPRHQAIRYFPRAEFGLPIVFHFIDAERGDPGNHTLEIAREKTARLASPFVLKPLMMTSGRAVPMIALLETPRLHELGLPLHLKGPDGPPTPVMVPDDVFVTAKAKDVPPLAAVDADDPREGLLRFVEHRWHVTRMVL